MLLVESVAGNVDDAAWKAKLDGARVDRLVLDQWDAQKNRLRTRTAGGAEVAISLQRGTFLRDGDVLAWDEANRTAIVAHITLQDVMVIDLATYASAAPPEELLRTCIELGHAIGNQHWPAIVKGWRVYVPLTVDKRVMASVMQTHGVPAIAAVAFVPAAEVIPYLSPYEQRLLFGSPHDALHTHHAGSNDRHV